MSEPSEPFFKQAPCAQCNTRSRLFDLSNACALELTERPPPVNAIISCQKCHLFSQDLSRRNYPETQLTSLLPTDCSPECIERFGTVHDESGPCDELFRHYSLQEWRSQCPPPSCAYPNVVDVKEEIQVLLSRRFGAAMLA